MKIRDIADTILFVFIVCAIMVIGVILSPLPPETHNPPQTCYNGLLSADNCVSFRKLVDEMYHKELHGRYQSPFT